MQATEEAAKMEAVAMPTVQHLLNGSLDALREAINSASAEEEPTRWVVSHIILGSALRMRANRVADDERARMYAEALGAFDVGADVVLRDAPGSPGCAHQLDEREQLQLAPERVLRAGWCAARGRWPSAFRWPKATSSSSVPCACFGRHARRRIGALRCRLVCRHEQPWMRADAARATNAGQAGLTILEEAVDVMHEALRVPSLEKLAAERATTQVNLSEALHALAERGMPAESLRYPRRRHALAGRGPVPLRATGLSLAAAARSRTHELKASSSQPPGSRASSRPAIEGLLLFRRPRSPQSPGG